MKPVKSVDQYHSSFEGDTLKRMNELRAIILSVLPQEAETISYNMPAYKHNGIICYYAGYKQHIGFYPTPGPIKAFAEELAKYKTSKGAIQFPLDKKIPVQLVKRLIICRQQQLVQKQTAKK